MQVDHWNALAAVIIALVGREMLIAPYNPDIYTRIYDKPRKQPWKQTALKLRRIFRRKV